MAYAPLLSALRIVGCRTPTVGSLLLDGAMTLPTAYALHLSNSECNCSSLPDSLPKSRSHVFIRDFHTNDHSGLTRLGIDPVYWNQNMKNATTPNWDTIEDQILSRRKLFVALKDLRPVLLEQQDVGAVQLHDVQKPLSDDLYEIDLTTITIFVGFGAQGWDLCGNTCVSEGLLAFFVRNPQTLGEAGEVVGVGVGVIGYCRVLCSSWSLPSHGGEGRGGGGSSEIVPRHVPWVSSLVVLVNDSLLKELTQPRRGGGGGAPAVLCHGAAT